MWLGTKRRGPSCPPRAAPCLVLNCWSQSVLLLAHTRPRGRAQFLFFRVDVKYPPSTTLPDNFLCPCYQSRPPVAILVAEPRSIALSAHPSATRRLLNSTNPTQQPILESLD